MTRPASRNVAAPKPDGIQLIFGVIGFAACWAFYLWAFDRGYDFRDEAAYLLWVKHAFTYKASVTEYGYLLRPLYLLVAANIAAYRLMGAIALGLCGALFGFALERFAAGNAPWRLPRGIVIVPCVTAVLWQFMLWQTTPNYNELNLCAVLLFFAALLLVPGTISARAIGSVGAATGLALLAGLAVTLSFLTKPTTGTLLILFALGWVWLNRPPRPLLLVGAGALGAMMAFLLAILAIDGTIGAFIAHKFWAVDLLLAQSRHGDIHGVVQSVIKPVTAGSRWTGTSIAALASSLLLFYGAALALAVRTQVSRLARVLSLAALLAVTGLVAFWRAHDPGDGSTSPIYHAWYLAPVLALVALAVLVLLRRSAGFGPRERRLLFCAAILALGPFAYSLGTDISIIAHMASASVLWIGASVMLALLLPQEAAGPALRTYGSAIAAATLGLVVGIAIRPGAIVYPLWQQNVALPMGSGMLFVDSHTAGYVEAMRRGAAAADLKPDTPVLDLSGLGPGLVFALNARAPGVPWLTNYAIQDDAHVLRVLGTVPPSELAAAWIVTGTRTDPRRYARWLRPLGIDFPAGYARVLTVSRDDLGWSQSLWKPRAAH